ncbi:MAG: glycosyltransferase [Clostridia bacterium]|nr:glycosyltransferase [Clostridia bacterium]
MNILFQIRSDYKNNLAGDSIQMLKTKEYLEKLGIRVDLSTQYQTDLTKYEIVHIFNLVRSKESFKFSQNALRQNKPYVLSTIYWNMSNYIKNDKTTRSTIEWWLHSNSQRKEILYNASILLPNSNLEMYMLTKDFNISKDHMVVPNCSDLFFYYAKPESFVSRFGLSNFVLSVGRISFRKNQLALIRSLKDTGLQLVLIGPKSNKEYFDMCKETAGHVLFLDEMKHHELASAYAAAKVHVLPSWFETPGLSSLEAGLAGCNIVTTSKGSTREYFKDLAWYCDPSCEESIRNAVLNAYHAPKGNALKQHILNNYTWETAASKTLEAYRKILQNKSI